MIKLLPITGAVVCYGVLFVAFVLTLLRIQVRSLKAHIIAGRCESVLSPAREYILSPLLFIAAVLLTLKYIIKGGVFQYGMVFGGILASSLSIWSFYIRRSKKRIFISKFISEKNITYKKYLNLYMISASPLPGYPDLPQDNTPPQAKPNRSRRRIVPLVKGMLVTYLLAREVIKAASVLGKEELETFVEKICIVWGEAALALTASTLKIIGGKLKGISGRMIFVANHASFMDFIIVPLAIYKLKQECGLNVFPTYMAARDHFLENRLIYNVLGIGRAMEAIGTIFVERRKRERDPSAPTSEAVKAIVDKGRDIVMFPQGTRAHPVKSPEGKVIGRGYYTTIRPEYVEKHKGHLKKGAAHIAIDGALLLAKKNIDLYIVPMGLRGTELIAPRGAKTIGSGVNIEVEFGEPFNVSSYIKDHKDMERNLLVDAIHEKIDEMLKGILDVENEIRRRLVLELRKIFGEDGLERELELLDAWGSERELLFSIIDCIYTLDTGVKVAFLKRLFELLKETSTPTEELVGFKRMVVTEMWAQTKSEKEMQRR